MLLQINNIVKHSLGKQILQDISLQINRGDVIGLAGETGSGKTTLLKIIGGLEATDEGVIILQGEQMMSAVQMLIPGYRQMSYMNQHTALMNHYRVYEMLAYSDKLTSDDIEKIVHQCRIGHLLQRWTHELSGGEKQRVALAFCMTFQPQVLLLDEPFSHLDRPNKMELYQVINELNISNGITVLMASHDPQELMSCCNRLVILRQGIMMQQDEPSNIYHYPVNAYCAGLLDDFILLKKEIILMFHFKIPQEADDKDWVFLRPSDMIISKEITPLSGKVASTRFNGLHSTLHVDTEWGTCILHTTENYKPGDCISLQLKKQPDHFL